MNETADQLAVIAGAGRFPFMVVDGARRAGLRVTVLALRGLADPELREVADHLRWTGLARLGGWIRLLKRTRVKRVILAGSVRKRDMYARFRLLKMLPDLTSLRLWFLRLQDRRNDAVLRAVADEFARHGIIMESCVRYCAEDLAPEGLLTRRAPTEAQRADIDFGWRIAREIGRLDIGQSVAVRETDVIAVEAIEGTDRMIERAGALCPRGGWVMVKTAKPQQDMRFDVPTIGPETIAQLKRHGAAVLVIEAGKTLIVERQRTLAEADRAGLVVLGRRVEE